MNPEPEHIETSPNNQPTIDATNTMMHEYAMRQREEALRGVPA